MTLPRKKKLWYLPDGTVAETYQPGARSSPFPEPVGVFNPERFVQEQERLRQERLGIKPTPPLPAVSPITERGGVPPQAKLPSKVPAVPPEIKPQEIRQLGGTNYRAVFPDGTIENFEILEPGDLERIRQGKAQLFTISYPPVVKPKVKETVPPESLGFDKTLRNLYPKAFEEGLRLGEDPLKTTDALLKQIHQDLKTNPDIFLNDLKTKYRQMPDETKALLRFYVPDITDEQIERELNPPTENKVVAALGKIPGFADYSLDDVLKEVETNPDKFLTTILSGGVTTAERDLLRAMGVDEATITEIIRTPQAVGKDIDMVAARGKVGGVKTADMRTQLKQGGVSPEETDKIIGLSKLNLDSEGWLTKWKSINPSAKKNITYGLFTRSFAAGLGGLLKSVGGVASWQKQENLAKNLNAIGDVLQSNRAVLDKPWTPTIETVLDPRFWQTTVAEALPFTLALIPVSILAYTAGTAGLTAIGVGTLWTHILTSIGIGIGSGIIEGTIEAGGAYNEAKGRNFTDEEAAAVANSVFLKDVGLLTGGNAFETFASFMPTPGGTLGNLAKRGLIKLIFRSGTIVGATLTEAGTEALQDVFQRQALGEKVIWDDEMKMTAIVGGLMGGAFGASGAVFTSIQERIVTRLPVDIKSDYSKRVQDLVKDGLSKEQAMFKALGELGTNKEVQRIADAVIAEVKREEATKQAERLGKLPSERFTPEVPQVAAERFTAQQPEAVTPVPAVEQVPGMPEAGLQPSMLPEEIAEIEPGRRWEIRVQGEQAGELIDNFGLITVFGNGRSWEASTREEGFAKLRELALEREKAIKLRPTTKFIEGEKPFVLESVRNATDQELQIQFNKSQSYLSVKGRSEGLQARERQNLALVQAEMDSRGIRPVDNPFLETKPMQKTPPLSQAPVTQVPGEPEAGYQPAMIEGVTEKEVRPKGKGRVTQISMDEQLQLENYKRFQEVEGLKASLVEDPVANFKFTMGGKRVGLESLISIREGQFPEYLTIKQAQAVNPRADITRFTQKGTKDYNHIPKDAVLDRIDFGDGVERSPDEIAQRVNKIRRDRAEIRELSRELTAEEAGITEPIEVDEETIEAAIDYQEAIDKGVPPDERPPDPPQAIIPPDPVPSYPDMPRDSEIKRIITQSEEQVRQDAPKALTNLLHKVPGVKQLVELERPGLKMTGENQKVLVAMVAEQAARSDVSVWAMATRLQLFKEIRDAFGKDVLRGDIARNISIVDGRYVLTPQQEGVLASITVHSDTILAHVVESYGAEIGRYTLGGERLIDDLANPITGTLKDIADSRGIYLPNVDVSEDVVEYLGSETRTIAQGRGKTRIWATARDRMAGKTPFMPELDVQKLLEGLDDFKASAAAGQTYKAAIGGLTKLEAMETTHPDLFKKMTALRKELSSLKGSALTIESNIGTAIDEFLSSSVEDADLLTLKDNLDVRLKAGKRKGLDMAAIQDKITDVQDQIDEIRPAWQAANLKPYVFIQQGLYRYFPSDQAVLITESLATTKNRLLGFVEKWRGQAFSGDFSPFTIQGVIGVLADPYGSLKAGLGGIRSAIQHKDFLRSVRIEALADDIANNPVEWGEYASLMGRSLTGTPKEYAAGFLSKIPGFDKFTENTFVTVTRGSFNFWKRNYTNMVKHGVPVLEAKVAAADIASKVYPLVSQTRLGQSQARHAVLRTLPTSYSFIRQPLNLTADALRGMGKIVTRQTLSPSESLAVKVAITGAASTLAVSATSAFLSAKAQGKDDDEAWQAALDAINPHPMNGKFASIIIGNVRIPLGGPYRALFRAFYPSEVKGVPFPVPFAGLPNYLKNRITPAPRAQLDLIVNKDYSGQQVIKGAFPENVLRFLEYEFENFLPLSAGAAVEAIRLGDKYREPMWQQVLGQFMGVNPITLDNTYIDRQIKQLGMEKEGEAKPFVIQKPEYFSTKDLYGDISYVLKKRTGEGFKDKPLTLAIKEAMELKKTADGFLNLKLRAITDDDWALLEARQDLDDTTEFDKKYPDLANVRQSDYVLLRERRQITHKKKLAEFDKAHPELGINPRQEWWKSNPKQNALLAVFGQADLLTPEAYTEFKRLVKELDIPDSALPERTLPPEGSLELHWKREQMVADGKEGSWEAQLMLLEDADVAKKAGVKSYAAWKGLKLSDTPKASLELKVKNADKLRLLDSGQPNSFGDKDGLNYKDDKVKDKDGLTERDRAVAQLYKDNPTLHDDQRKIQAIEIGTNEKPTPDDVIKGHVDYMKIQDELTSRNANFAKGKLAMVDQSGDIPKLNAYGQWRLDNAKALGLTDEPLDLTQVPIWNIKVQYEKEFDYYDDGIKEKRAKIQYATENARDDAIRAERWQYYQDNPEFWKNSLEVAARSLRSKDGIKLSEGSIPQYVELFQIPSKGFRNERFIVENPAFAAEMYELTGKDVYLTKPEDVPDRAYDDIYDSYPDLFDELDGLSKRDAYVGKYYIQDEVEREARRNELRYTQTVQTYSGVKVTNKELSEFGLADKRREAYGLFISEQFVQDYVDRANISKPKDWALISGQSEKTDKNGGSGLWFEDDWFMIEHPDYYENVYLNPAYNNGIQRDKWDFRKVPMTADGKPDREVFVKYLEYVRLTTDYWRDLYRKNNPDLDEWGQIAFGWKPIIRQKERQPSSRDRFFEGVRTQQEEFERRLAGVR